MAEERNEEQFNPTDGKGNHEPMDQQRQPNEFGQQPSQPGDLQPPETMTDDSKVGDQTSSEDTETDTDILQADRTTGTQSSGNSTGEGFIGSPSGDATTGEDSDIETGHPSRLQDNDSDIEGSSGAA